MQNLLILLSEKEFLKKHPHRCYGSYALRQQELANPSEVKPFDTDGFLLIAEENKANGYSNECAKTTPRLGQYLK